MSADNGKRSGAGGLSAMWGLVLDHLTDKHAQAVAATRVNPEGGVARTSEGVIVTSKELYLQVLLNADDNYTNAGYQERMEQSFGAIFLGMDWSPEYEKEATPTNAAIGKVTRRDAFEVTLKETRTAIPTVPAPGGIVDILALSDIVLARVCSHYFDIPGRHLRKGRRVQPDEPDAARGLPGGLYIPLRLHLPSESRSFPEFHRPAHRADPEAIGREVRGRQACLRAASGRAVDPRPVRAIPRSQGQ